MWRVRSRKPREGTTLTRRGQTHRRQSKLKGNINLNHSTIIIIIIIITRRLEYGDGEVMYIVPFIELSVCVWRVGGRNNFRNWAIRDLLVCKTIGQLCWEILLLFFFSLTLVSFHVKYRYKPVVVKVMRKINIE